MKSMKILFALAAAAAIAIAGDSTARAATATSTVAVSATVVKNCTMTNGAITFGNYDPVVTNAAANLDVASTGFSVSCTKGVGYAISLDLGSNATGTTRRMKDAAGDFLNYEIYNDSGRTTVWNATNTVAGTAASKAALALTAYGRVPSAQDVPTGSYTDTVTATVTF
ncbi:MAG TPA: spore coat U domain-containing protein [Myxococcales bacterium]|nr:spore coat U domain-containing protein [Myxococcales bacterium]